MLLPVGIALFALGLIGFIYGIFQRLKAGRITGAPLVKTNDIAMRGRAVAGAKGAVSAQGHVACPVPVHAPFSGVPCLYYEIRCTARWKDGDTHKSKVVDEQKVAAQFTIDDGSGPVGIDAREGGDFEPTQKKSEIKGTGLIGGLTGTDLEFGNYRVSTPILDVGTKYEVEEVLLPLVPTLYACGRIGDAGNLIASPSWQELLLSSKSRDALLAAATKTSKIALGAGALLLLVGGGAATAGTLLAQQEPAAASPPAASSPITAPTPTPTFAALPSAPPASSSASPGPSVSAISSGDPAALTAKPKAKKRRKKKSE